MFGYPKLPETASRRVKEIGARLSYLSGGETVELIEFLADKNHQIHERTCFNLNPATNIMNPRAEAILSAGLGTRPSLGYPGDKYEMGLEAIEEIEVIATALSAEVFQAQYAEIRVASGAMANLYAFMALCQPEDKIIAPPSSIGGHVTHHAMGCAGLYGLQSINAPVSEDQYTVDLEALEKLVAIEKPKLITIGGSLNLDPHPVAEIVEIACGVGARTLFDAAHQCGIIAGGAWNNPLNQGVDVMTMSTYKSLGGPPAGLVLTNDSDIAARLDQIAFPGMTANFDAAKSAALAITMADWRDFGKEYASQMIDLSKALAQGLKDEGLPVFETRNGATQSHQFALEAAAFGGGQMASKKLRAGGILACGIGLPIAEVEGDLNGLRLGTAELARIGMQLGDMPRLAKRVAQILRANDASEYAASTADWRMQFDQIHYVHQSATG